MAKFTFSLEQSASEEDLVYRGSDSIVWDRINALRLRRGLPSLTDIGLPRPAEDVELTGTTFPNPEAEPDSVTISGEGLTQEQALQIFREQNSAGSFVGLKPGQTINAGTQALAGLKSAQNELAAAIGAGLDIDLPNIDSIKSLQGLTSGLPVGDGINIADLAKQPTALAGIDQALPDEIRGAMAQANKLTGQSADQITDIAGVGKYGLDVGQLESAGLIKPGTAGKYLTDGTNTLTDVLNSPTVWTGKDNINNLDSLLSDPLAQDLIQNNLMADGISELKENGVPTDLLSGASLAGTSLVAAKGADLAKDWIDGKLPGVDTADLSGLARDGAFGAAFGADKISDAMRQQFPALPAIGTVDRATLNAASGRVLGNEKIPDLNFSVSALPTPNELTDRLNQLFERFSSLREDASLLEGRIARTAIPEFLNEQYDNLEAGEQLLSDLTGINSQLLSLQREAEAKDPPLQSTISQIGSIPIDSVIAQLETALDQLRQRLAAGS